MRIVMEGQFAETIKHKDVEFKVYAGRKLTGTLKISKGSVEWCPRKCRYGHHLNWRRFGEVMEQRGRMKKPQSA